MFDGINSLIKECYANGISHTIYQGIVILAFVVQFVFLIFYRKKCGISLKNSILTVTIIYPVLYLWMLVVTWAELGFRNWGANNILRLYIWVPLLVLPFSKLLKVKATALLDFLAPSMALQQVIGHTVCPFDGCCHGYPCDWGIYNPIQEATLFPNQWLECLVALAIFIFLLIYADKTGHRHRGDVFAAFLAVFGFTRFLLELLRDNNKVILGISELAFHALLACAVGAVWYIVILRRGNTEAATVQ